MDHQPQTALRAIKDIVISRPDPLEEMSSGGIWFPDSYSTATDWRPAGKKLAEWATVVALGPECKILKVNDRIFLGDCIGMWFSHDNQDYLACHENHVIAMEATNGTVAVSGGIE